MFRLFRDRYTEKGTFGQMTGEVGEFFCYTLEPTEKSGQLIPEGEYNVMLTVSGRASRGELWTPDPNKKLPLLEPADNAVFPFEGIRIHAGNALAHTKGCILVGSAGTMDGLMWSRDKLTELMKLPFPTRLRIEKERLT